MFISRSIGRKPFGIDPHQPVGIFVPDGTLSPNLKFQNVTAFVEWIRAEERIPGIIQWELLSICNFKCPFCYIRGHTPKKVFDLARAIGLIDEFVKIGVVEVILTGGEPLIHPKFITIYEKLRRSGVIVAIYTNLALITEEQLELFQRFPPYCVEVSIYGHDEVSYKNATKQKAFGKVLANVERLLELDINVLCKTPVTTLTSGSIDWIRQWCTSRSIPYVASPNIEDGLDGFDLSHFTLTGRAYYTAEKHRLDLSKNPISLDQSTKRDPCKAFNCGVAKVGAYIGYDGKLFPCANIRDQGYDIMKQSFVNAWNKIVEDVIPHEGKPIKGCDPNCRAKPICKMCPAIALCDEHGEYTVDPAFCQKTLSKWDEIKAPFWDFRNNSLPKEIFSEVSTQYTEWNECEMI